MKLNFFANLKFGFVIGLLFLSFGIISAQYYYFDTGSTSYPYQQGCSETLNIRVNTESHATGARAGRFLLVLDPSKIIYSTSSVASVLRTNLFIASSQTFMDWTSDGSPSWKVGSNNTVLNIDRKNNTTDYKGTNSLYGYIAFVPLYNPSVFPGSFGMEYVAGINVTDETTLSMIGGTDIISSSSQIPLLTGTYDFIQEPCLDDNTNPSIIPIIPVNGSNKRKNLSGISLFLNEASTPNGLTVVPYIWTGGIWTGNDPSSNRPGNQYGINLNTLSLTISGNGNTQVFTGGSLGLNAVGSGKTWQDNIRSYGITIDPVQLNNYGIEKVVKITTDVDDLRGNHANQNIITLNSPVGPRALGAFSPVNGAIFVNLSAPVQFGVQDDRAGVDSGSIQVTLEGFNGTSYGPYIFSGNDLNLSGAISTANQPNYYINITNHPDFPTSGNIRAIISAEDMENNIDTLPAWTFSTRPACSELQCCDDIYVQIGTGTPTIYSYADLYVNYASGFLPIFDNQGATGYLDCRETFYGISVYSGDGVTGTFISQFTGTELVFSGTNIKAIFTGTDGNVVLLIRIGNFIVKVFPSSRVTSMDNIGRIIFYDQSKNAIYSGEINTSTIGTGNFIEEIPAGTYYVTYKGQSHLSSYISGFVVVQNSGLMLLDFTTGSNLYGTQQKNISEDDGYGYQSAGDLKNINGIYDYMVNGNDIAIIVADGLFDNGIQLLDPRNLNGDPAVNSADISIIGINFEKTDISFYGVGGSNLFNR